MISSRYDSRIPFYLLVLVSVSYVLSIFTLQLFGGMIAILWLFERNFEKKKAIDSFIVAVSIYGIARLLSIALSEYQGESIQAIYKEALFFISVFSFGFYLKVLDEKKIRLLIYTFIAGAVINSLIGLVRFNLGIVERAESFSSGYTVFSGYLAAALGISLAAYNFTDVKKKYTYLNAISSGIIFAGIITSLGRANIAIAVLILITSIILKMINLRQVLLILLIAGGVSYISFFNNQGGITQRMEAPAQLSDRDILYKGAVELIWEQPVFGFGPRTFKEIFPFRDQFADKGIGGWHNHFLQVYFESGFIGLSAYLVLLFIVFKSGYKLIKINPRDENKITGWGLLISVTALFLSAFFSGILLDSPVLSIVFAFLVSLMASEIYKEKHNNGIKSI